MIKFLDRLVSPLISWMTTRRQALFTLYVTYIWDAIRDEYIESRKRNYQENYCRLMIRRRVKSFPRRVSEKCTFSSVQHQSSILVNYNSSSKRQKRRISITKSRRRELDALIDKDFNCPVPPMPKCVRGYQVFSTIYVIYSFFKFAIVSATIYGWLGIDPINSCYLPGRLAPVVDTPNEFVWVAFSAFSMHVIYRYMWYCRCNKLELDCFIFLCYDRETVIEKQFKLLELNDPKSPPEVSYRKYLCDKVFFEQQVDTRGSTMYTMRRNRTVEHYDRLNDVVTIIRHAYWVLLCTFFIPGLVHGLYIQISNDGFNVSYGSCKSLANVTDVENFRWSYEDNLRITYLFFDLLDCLMFYVDSSLAMIVPYSATILVTYDLSLSYDTLSSRMASFNERLRSLLGKEDQEIGSSLVTPIKMTFIEDLEHESNSIFNEIISIFEQVRCVDEFIRRFSIFTFICWFFMNMTFQAFSVFQDSMSDRARQFHLYVQVYLHTLFITAFVMMSSPHRRSRILYSRICSAMALCSNKPVLKISWRWLLEYYRKDSTKYTLHFIGQSYELSTYNVLRAMSWFVTCTIIVVTLWKQKQELQ